MACGRSTRGRLHCVVSTGRPGAARRHSRTRSRSEPSRTSPTTWVSGISTAVGGWTWTTRSPPGLIAATALVAAELLTRRSTRRSNPRMVPGVAGLTFLCHSLAWRADRSALISPTAAPVNVAAVLIVLFASAALPLLFEGRLRPQPARGRPGARRRHCGRRFHGCFWFCWCRRFSACTCGTHRGGLGPRCPSTKAPPESTAIRTSLSKLVFAALDPGGAFVLLQRGPRTLRVSPSRARGKRRHRLNNAVRFPTTAMTTTSARPTRAGCGHRRPSNRSGSAADANSTISTAATYT